MHPINHLFEEIYRNYWGISPAIDRPERRRLAKPAARNRDLPVRPERRQELSHRLRNQSGILRSEGASAPRPQPPASRR